MQGTLGLASRFVDNAPRLHSYNIPVGVHWRQAHAFDLGFARAKFGAEYGDRTRDIQLGKLALYQLS